MEPVFRPWLSGPSGEVDVAIVGAGAAGIAAARRCLAAGVTVAVLEARDRVGGRALTVALAGHPVDLGPHWLHAGPINPLVRLGHARGERLRRAPPHGHLVVGRRRGTARESAAFDRAFAHAERALTQGGRALAQGGRAHDDRPAAQALPFLGPWRDRIAMLHGLVSGRPLDEVSLQDFPSLEYADNFFIAGGLGAYVARLAAGLPVRLGAPVRTIDWSGDGVRIEGPAGQVRARAAILTIPMMVLQEDAVRFTPALPGNIRDAIGAFVPGTYEHVVLHWPSAPFRGPDRFANFVGGRVPPPGLLTRIDGRAFHYVELDAPTVRRLSGRGREAAARFAREAMRSRFGNRAVADLRVAAVTDWGSDPLVRGSWAVVPPGGAPIRDRLKDPVAGRLWFAGEALSRAQWGTVGGAWEEGERAAESAIGHLRRSQPTQ